MPRDKKEILSDLRTIENQLSPENLYWDGERSHKEAEREAIRLNTQRTALVKELGYEPSFKEIYGIVR
jgi:hypothetical protein